MYYQTHSLLSLSKLNHYSSTRSPGYVRANFRVLPPQYGPLQLGFGDGLGVGLGDGASELGMGVGMPVG